MDDKKQPKDVIETKYQPKKINNKKMLGLIMDKLTVSGKERFESCSTYNEFVATADKEHKKNIRNNACKNRFCPVCAWKKSKKNAFELTTIIKAIEIEKKQNFIFMTLTTPNVKSYELNQEIERMNTSFHKLFRRRGVKRSINGYVRKLELTYDENQKITAEMYDNIHRKKYFDRRGLKIGDDNPNYDTYNPHFHVIMAVDKSYFTNSKKYIKQSEWLEMWREVTGMQEIMSLHIVKVKNALTGKSSKGSSINEIAKYSAKDMEMVQSKEVFDNFYHALYGKQLLTYNGFFKEYKAKFKNKELKQYIDKDTHEYVLKLIATWNDELMKYEQKYTELTAEEKKEFNNQMINEIEVD